MTSFALPLPSFRTDAAGSVERRQATLDASLVALCGALAAAGLIELLLQRVVYRVGVHIPRSGLFLELYRFATWTGDLAFRFAAVLLVLATVGLALSLLRGRTHAALGFVLLAVLGGNLLAWPLGLGFAPGLVAVLFALGAAWAVGESVRQQSSHVLRAGVALAGVTLLLGQYRIGLAGLGALPRGVAEVQLASEVALLATAALLAAAAFAASRRRLALAASLVVTLLLVLAYVREPATLAIVSLWSTGVTLSLPPALYLAAFGGVIFAGVAWARSPSTRHLGIAIALLVVAGVQPQALHHDLTALVGLTLLSLGPARPDCDSEAHPMESKEQYV